MSTLKEAVPSSVRGPVGIGSLIVGVFGLTIGYILFVLGVSLVYDLAPHTVSTTEGGMVVLTGIGLAVLGYAGLRGFMYFSY